MTTVEQAAGELYAADPDEFVDRRRALAAAARQQGDADAAKVIAALRKPTRSAWTLNALARTDAGLIERAARLSTQLRDAERRLDGAALRELSRERRELVDAMARAAFAATGQREPSAALREEVNATLTAAFADPDVAEQLASGRLLRAAQWAGFGLDAGARPDLAVVPPTTPARPAKPTRPSQSAPPTAKPRAPSAAERAHRERVAAAEKEVVTARRQLVKAETEAAKHRDRVDALEQQLADARYRLTESGHRVRDAKADLRRAEQRLDRATTTR